MITPLSNLNSQFARRAGDAATRDLDRALARLSSGLRIGNASDDAAGLAIGERLKSQILGFEQAGRNAQDGLSLTQTAEGAINQLEDNFQRIRTLSVEAANGTYTMSDRAAMQMEVDQLVAQDKTIASQTAFNHINLLDGSQSSIQLQIGANATQVMDLDFPSVFKQATTTLTTVTAPLYQAGVSGTVTGAIGTGDLTINGANIGASVAGAQAGQNASSAWAIANAINQSPSSGVSAVATNALSGTDVFSAANLAGGSLIINGVAIGAISGADGNAVTASAVSAINAESATTGVTASATVGFVTGGPHHLPPNTPDSVLTLSTADGRDITIAQSVGGSAAKLGLSPGISHGKLEVDTAISTTPIPVIIAGRNPGLSGLSAGTTLASPTGQTVTIQVPVGSGGEPAIDLSNVATAGQAITYVDSKLQEFNSVRARLGAYQNRLAAISLHLTIEEENTSASRSRIVDADFAAETAALTRAQILKSASSAMTAQANASPMRLIRLLLG